MFAGECVDCGDDEEEEEVTRPLSLASTLTCILQHGVQICTTSVYGNKFHDPLFANCLEIFGCGF